MRIRYRPTSDFKQDLQERIEEYFASSPHPRNGDRPFAVYSVVVMLWWLASYLGLVFLASTPPAAVFGLLSMVLASTAMSMGVSHGAIHGALGWHGALPWLARNACRLVAVDMEWWDQKHSRFHHAAANVWGVDNDIENGFIMRLSPFQEWRPHHRFQWIYLWFVYPLQHLAMTVRSDTRYAFTGWIGGSEVPRPRGEAIGSWLFTKSVAVVVLFVIPMLFHPPAMVLGFVFAGSLGFGLLMALVFQVNHCVGDGHYPQPAPDGTMPVDRWTCQVEGATEVARRSRLLTWLLGGVNLHAIHHLLPEVSPTHYPALSDLVREVAAAHGVEYRRYESYPAALGAHLRFLRRLGRPEARAEPEYAR